jgi:hypothetical protein
VCWIQDCRLPSRGVVRCLFITLHPSFFNVYNFWVCRRRFSLLGSSFLGFTASLSVLAHWSPFRKPQIWLLCAGCGAAAGHPRDLSGVGVSPYECTWVNKNHLRQPEEVACNCRSAFVVEIFLKWVTGMTRLTWLFERILLQFWKSPQFW